MKKNVLNTALLLIPSATTGLLCGVSIGICKPHNPKHIHTLDGYTIEDNKIYGICNECGKKFKLSNEQFDEINNKILVKTDDHYELIVDKTLAQIVNELSEGATADIYLISGEYSTVGISARVTAEEVTNVHLHGIVDYDNNLLSQMTVPGGPQTAEGINLYIDHIKMLGLTTIEESWWTKYGLQFGTIEYTKCSFIGCYSIFCYEKARFSECSFDSSMVIQRDSEGKPIGSDYAVWCYEMTPEISFENCHFTSAGKAVKAFKPGSTQISKITFLNCNFDIKGELLEKDKSAIALDSTYITDPGKYKVLVKNCKQVGYGIKTICTDKGTHSEITIE